MSSRRSILIPMLAILAACGPQTPAPGEAEAAAAPAVFSTQAVRDSVVSVFTRLNEAATRKDVDAFMALWERSDSLVYARSGLTFLGWDAIAANHTEGFSVPNPWSFETGDVHVRVLGPDAAVGTVFTRTSRPRWFLLTAALTATPDGWKIIQAHGSYAEDGMDPFGQAETR